MSKPPSLRIVESNGAGSPSEAHAPGTTRDPRALNRLDWIGLVLIALALALAPLFAGSFANLQAMPVLEDSFSVLSSLGLPAIACLTGSAIAVLLWREQKRKVAIGAVPGLAGMAVLLAGWSLLTVIRSATVAASLNALMTLLCALLLAGCISRVSRDPKGLKALLMTVIAAGSVAAALGVHEYLGSYRGNPQYRTFSTFVNPDFLAGYLLLTLPPTLAAFVVVKERLEGLLLGIGLTLQVACLGMTGSRAGFGMFAVSLVAFLIVCQALKLARGRGRMLGLALALLLFGAFAGRLPLTARVGTPLPSTNASTTPRSGTGSAPDSQAHSAQFRRYTWIGTVRMATAHPVMGTGIGTFETAYPRYAETAFTAHAHNSYLQWAGETGIPGELFLLAVIAAATAFAAHVLVSRRTSPDDADGPAPLEPATVADARYLLLAGLLTAILASLLHSLFDSDWYVCATLVTFAAIIALTIGLARDIAPLATQIPRALGREMKVIGLALALFLGVRGLSLGASRAYLAAGESALREGRLDDAVALFRFPITLSPLDPMGHLERAAAEERLGRLDAARDDLNSAAHAAPIGKTTYRLGVFYLRHQQLDLAESVLRSERAVEPRNVQSMRVLADALAAHAGIALSSGLHPGDSAVEAPPAPTDANRIEEASRLYGEMNKLETSPYGLVRAMPEIPETEFIYGHAGLGDIAFAQKDFRKASDQYREAERLLSQYWSVRNTDMNREFRSPQKRSALDTLYSIVLTRLQIVLRRQGPMGRQEAQTVGIEQHKIELENQKEQTEESRQSPSSQTP